MKTNKINVVLSLNKSQLQRVFSNEPFSEENRINDNGWHSQTKASGKTHYTYSTWYIGAGASTPDPGTDHAHGFGAGASKIG